MTPLMVVKRDTRRAMKRPIQTPTKLIRMEKILLEGKTQMKSRKILSHQSRNVKQDPIKAKQEEEELVLESYHLASQLALHILLVEPVLDWDKVFLESR